MATSCPEHVYVYAATSGRPSDRALARLAPVPGGEAPRILTLDEDLSLIVSCVPAATYNAEAIERQLGDLDWVSHCGAAHHSVADTLAKTHVVIPFRLFSIFSSEASLLESLRRTRPRIRKAFARVEGRQEWVLRIARPDPNRVQRDPAAAARRKRSTASGTNFLRVKADLRREEREHAARVAGAATQVFEGVRQLADQSTSRGIEPGTNLLLDAVFLIDTRRVPTFKRVLAKAAGGLLRDGCRISLTGPWPPYSFASLE